MYCKPKLIAPPSGGLTCSHENGFGSKCLFTCRNGYRIKGSVVRHCEAKEGKPPAYWTGDETHCESKSVYIYNVNQSFSQSVSQSINQSIN